MLLRLFLRHVQFLAICVRATHVVFAERLIIRLRRKHSLGRFLLFRRLGRRLFRRVGIGLGTFAPWLEFSWCGNLVRVLPRFIQLVILGLALALFVLVKARECVVVASKTAVELSLEERTLTVILHTCFSFAILSLWSAFGLALRLPTCQ